MGVGRGAEREGGIGYGGIGEGRAGGEGGIWGGSGQCSGDVVLRSPTCKDATDRQTERQKDRERKKSKR